MNQTETVRKYCHNFKGKLFDLNYLSKTIFDNIPLSNLRKYVTRFVEEGILFQVSKGIFVIGKPNQNIESLIINHYLFGFCHIGCGIPSDKYLLFLEGIIEVEPPIKTIMSNKTFSNRNINNIKIRSVDTAFDLEAGKLMKVLELIQCETMLEENERIMWVVKIHEYLKDYNDSYFRCHNICYPRKVYLRLANLLNMMHISNRVMEIYDDKKKS